MKLTGEQALPAPRQAVWDLLVDPQRLMRLVPGCEKLEATGPDQFAGVISVGIAAVKGVYQGTIRLEDKRPLEHYKMTIDGKGKQGFARGSGTLDLTADGAQRTVIRYSGDVQIGGPLLQVGQRMVESAAKMMLGQFFAAAEAELKAHAAGTVARHGLLLNFLRYLRSLVRGFLGRG